MDFSQKIPSYLVERSNIVRLILFTASFALVFINIYSPFGADNWFNVSKLEFLFYSSLIILTGVLVVVISRIIMYQITKKGKRRLSLGQYLLWILIEIISMSQFYTLYEFIILDDPREFGVVFKASMINTSLVLLIPYATTWLYFSWRDKNKRLERILEGEEPEYSQSGMIIFKDEKGTMRLTLKKEDLLYLKGAENYVTIYYNDHQKHSKFLLRNTLKKLDKQLKNQNIIRCHRSYMVNFSKVKLIERGKSGFKIKLDTSPVVEIPVTKTYINEVFEQFEMIS